MDRVERYRGIVRRLIEEYASDRPSHGQIDTEAIVDPEKDHNPSEEIFLGFQPPEKRPRTDFAGS